LGAESKGLDVCVLSSYWADKEVLRKNQNPNLPYIQDAGKRLLVNRGEMWADSS